MVVTRELQGVGKKEYKKYIVLILSGQSLSHPVHLLLLVNFAALLSSRNARTPPSRFELGADRYGIMYLARLRLWK